MIGATRSQQQSRVTDLGSGSALIDSGELQFETDTQGGLHLGGLETQATDFGSGPALTGGLQSRERHSWGQHPILDWDLHSEGQHFEDLEARSTDFNPCPTSNRDLHSGGLHFKGLRSEALGYHPLGVHTTGATLWRSTL